MIVTAAWVTLLAACAALETAAHRPGARISTLGKFGAWLATRVPGRILLWATWVFAGVHLFTRYTIPH